MGQEWKQHMTGKNGAGVRQVLFALNQTLLQHESVRAGSLQAPYTTEDLIKHYNCGDLNAVIFNHDTSQLPNFINTTLPPHEQVTAQEIDSYFRQELIYKRNERMGKRVMTLLQENEDKICFFAFGAGHFLGNNTVIDVLRQAGLEVEHTPAGQTIHSCYLPATVLSALPVLAHKIIVMPLGSTSCDIPMFQSRRLSSYHHLTSGPSYSLSPASESLLPRARHLHPRGPRRAPPRRPQLLPSLRSPRQPPLPRLRRRTQPCPRTSCYPTASASWRSSGDRRNGTRDRTNPSGRGSSMTSGSASRTAPPPRHHHCPSRPRTAPEQPSPPSSSPTRASSRKSRGWPAAQRPAAHSPPWASSPPSLPASQPPSCCTPSGSPDLGRPPPCRVQRKKPEKPMGGSAATPTAPATTSRGARHLMGSPDGIR
ncbi:metalloprotease TIKI2 isoform X2 [Neophocaena asiaeorientalis asiaeorientalis]|uniref:Metalloprotease TIKI n=1 Tax=Neophocaena asiaeorientalis asiaeorientalis TaxID=1706337 RepID=A0A341AZU1_NEOAA|nr:metalloprotease TIKI2 isoform X2 [Neophocaena asiaeorientalis asiaeorientalis]